MNSFTRVPVTAAVFAGMAILLSGCIAYDAASTVVDAGATVVSTTVDVAGDIVTSPFDGDDSKKK
jgi:archaellin